MRYVKTLFMTLGIMIALAIDGLFAMVILAIVSGSIQ